MARKSKIKLIKTIKTACTTTNTPPRDMPPVRPNDVMNLNNINPNLLITSTIDQYNQANRLDFVNRNRGMTFRLI